MGTLGLPANAISQAVHFNGHVRLTSECHQSGVHFNGHVTHREMAML